ncbi:protein misato homolog 1 [Ornithorhynchus anatinus]|uniref:protein misato homolog 1 n=1 Tax=Ornithorhynchus anatinus TaxID=9258 RepID=UPI0010A927E6|nr:protein misato homolog 1 [Ornithorhynchus anatinus]
MAGGGREVVTLQLGHFAGFVGAHWWNLQDAALDPEGPGELCPHVQFRSGRTPRGRDALTPRLILMDLKGSLSSLPRDATTEQSRQAPLAWQGSVSTHREEPPARPPDLRDPPRADAGARTAPSPRRPLAGSAPGDGPRVWSDVLRVPLHPRSVCLVRQFNHDGDTGRLEAFGQGERLLAGPRYAEELEDRLHFFVEECDCLQGFQVLCDVHDGFAGVGARAAELLRDEYPGRGILTWGLCPPPPRSGPQPPGVYRLLNTALSLVPLAAHSSLLCPLTLAGGLGLRPPPPPTFPLLHYEAADPNHSSAILAAALDTVTVPYRLRSAPACMTDLAALLCAAGRKVTGASVALPFPLAPGRTLPDALSRLGAAAPWTPLSARAEEAGAGGSFAQSVVLRGVEPDRQTGRLPPGTAPPSALHAAASGDEVLARYLQRLQPGVTSVSQLLRQPCPVPPTFPRLFSSRLSARGLVLDRPRVGPAVAAVPVLAGLQSWRGLGRALRGLAGELARVDVRRWASYLGAGVERDDVAETVHALRALAGCYPRADGADDGEDDDREGDDDDDGDPGGSPE